MSASAIYTLSFRSVHVPMHKNFISAHENIHYYWHNNTVVYRDAPLQLCESSTTVTIKLSKIIGGPYSSKNKYTSSSSAMAFYRKCMRLRRMTPYTPIQVLWRRVEIILSKRTGTEGRGHLWTLAEVHVEDLVVDVDWPGLLAGDDHVARTVADAAAAVVDFVRELIRALDTALAVDRSHRLAYRVCIRSTSPSRWLISGSPVWDLS